MMDLFSEEKQHFNLPQAELIYYPAFFNGSESDQLYRTLHKNTLWQQDDITVFGKTYPQPRLTALYGTDNNTYTYSNITMYPKAFTKELLYIKHKIEATVRQSFNTVLLNYYRSGSDSNGWHADNEKELGTNPVIASLSFGAERYFHFKHRKLKTQRHKLLLHHGSLLIMKGEMQHYWLHQIAKTKQPVDGRINLTFRSIKVL